MFRKVAWTTSPLVLGAVAVKKSDSSPGSAVKDELAHYKCKPSELPIYTPLHLHNKPKPAPHPPKQSAARQSIECGIRSIRVELFSAYNSVISQKKGFEDIIETGKAHTQAAVDYLNEPANTLPRAGAIAIGGVSGAILAIRGGFFRKLLYTSAGAGGIASLCYPKEAEKYAQLGLVEAKKGVAIAYNFVAGVKPGENATPEPISKFPTSLSELSDLAGDLANSAKEALFSSKK